MYQYICVSINYFHFSVIAFKWDALRKSPVGLKINHQYFGFLKILELRFPSFITFQMVLKRAQFKDRDAFSLKITFIVLQQSYKLFLITNIHVIDSLTWKYYLQVPLCPMHFVIKNFWTLLFWFANICWSPSRGDGKEVRLSQTHKSEKYQYKLKTYQYF